MSKSKLKRLVSIFFGLVILATSSFYVRSQIMRTPVLEIYFFDTPGSPSVLIRTENDKRILVNGGANADIVRRVTKVLPFFSRRIDEIVYFSEDAKHSTGLIEIGNRYKVGTTTFLTINSTGRTYSNLTLGLADAKKGALLLSAEKEKLLLIPFNPNSLTKKMASSTHPDFLVYLAQTNRIPKPSTGKTKPKADPMPWVNAANRFNLRELGEIKTTVVDGRFVYKGDEE